MALEADEIVDGQIELNESYFGGHRKGKRGRGAAGKVAVFGLLKRQGKIFTVVVENTKTNGIDRKNFPLFLKKCEFWFNVGSSKEQLKTLRKWSGI